MQSPLVERKVKRKADDITDSRPHSEEFLYQKALKFESDKPEAAHTVFSMVEYLDKKALEPESLTPEEIKV